MDKEEKLSSSAKPSKTKRQSERVLKRKENAGGSASNIVPKIVRKKNSKQKLLKPSVESSTIKKSEVKINASANGKKRRKIKSVDYEIDCSGINMNIKDFQKDLWNRATNGKFSLAKNVRIKRSGNVTHMKSRSYISKKCVRSNVHFLTTVYLKKKTLDRPVHVVGNGNQYKLMYK